MVSTARAGSALRWTQRRLPGCCAAPATDHRHFCPACGSSLFGTHDKDGEVEVRLGALDEAPSGLAPGYELWTPRRERWQQPVAGAAQHPRNRP